MARRKRIGSLDFIKFIASVLIVFHHFQGDYAYEKRLITFSGGNFYYGFVVEVFFLISGILVSMKNEKNSELSYGSFLKNRILRLFPMTTYSTLVYIVFVIVFKACFDIWYCCEPLSPIAVLRSLLLVYCGGALVYKNVEPNCILWYVCVLMLCYAIYWIILFIQKKLKINARYLFTFMVFLGIGIISYSIELPFLNFCSARGYMSFFFGVELVDIYTMIKNKKIIPLISGLVILIFIIYGIYDSETLFGNGLDQQMTLTFILYPAIIGLLSFGKLGSMFKNKLIKFLGNISFEIYLCHYHVFMGIHLLEYFGLIEFPRSDLGMIFALGIIIVMSICVYLFVEVPINKIITKRVFHNCDFAQQRRVQSD